MMIPGTRAINSTACFRNDKSLFGDLPFLFSCFCCFLRCIDGRRVLLHTLALKPYVSVSCIYEAPQMGMNRKGFPHPPLNKRLFEGLGLGTAHY